MGDPFVSHGLQHHYQYYERFLGIYHHAERLQTANPGGGLDEY